MSNSKSLTERLDRDGAIEDPRDAALAALVLVAALAALVILVSPAVAIYLVASHHGIGTAASAMVGVGAYTLVILYLVFGGGS